MLIRFHKNGLLLIKDSDDIIHVLEPKETLKDVATYIWNTDSMKEYRIEGEESLKDIKSLKFVELTKEKHQRLRNLTELEKDNYFSEA